MNDVQKLTKLQCYDEIAKKVSYIESISSLVICADNADGDANLDAVGLCSSLARDIKKIAHHMVRAEH